jgi:hypothetical protein
MLRQPEHLAFACVAASSPLPWRYYGKLPQPRLIEHSFL